MSGMQLVPCAPPECDTSDPDHGPLPRRVRRGLWELHRLTKEAVADWFTARRAEDGLTSSTQKRPQTGARSDRDVLEDAFEGPKTRNNRQLDGSIASDSQARATAGGGKQLIGSYGSSRDMSGLGGGGGGSGSGEGGRGGGKGGVEEELLDGLTSFAGKQAAKTAVAMKVRRSVLTRTVSRGVFKTSWGPGKARPLLLSSDIQPCGAASL